MILVKRDHKTAHAVTKNTDIFCKRTLYQTKKSTVNSYINVYFCWFPGERTHIVALFTKQSDSNNQKKNKLREGDEEGQLEETIIVVCTLLENFLGANLINQHFAQSGINYRLFSSADTSSSPLFQASPRPCPRIRRRGILLLCQTCL